MNSFTTMKLHKTLTLKDLEKAKALIDREKLDTPLPGYVMGLKAHRDLEDAIRIKEPLMMPMFSMAQDFYGISIFKTKNLKPEEIWEFEDWEDAKDFLGFINFCTERNINWRVILEAVKHARRPLVIPASEWLKKEFAKRKKEEDEFVQRAYGKWAYGKWVDPDTPT